MTKDKTIRVLVDFISNPEKFGCEIRYTKREGYSHRFGMIMSGYKAVAAVSVGESCNHPTLGVVNIRGITGSKAVVHDGKKEHTVNVNECVRIR